jgi:hypothetical protein
MRLVPAARSRPMKVRLLVLGLVLAIVLLAVGGWTVQGLRHATQLNQ